MSTGKKPASGARQVIPLTQTCETGFNWASDGPSSLLSIAPTIINGYVENAGSEREVLTPRPGLVTQGYNPSGSGDARGYYYWSGSDKHYYVRGANLYSITSDLATTATLSTAFDTTSQFVGFAEYNSGSARYLIILDGVKGWYIDTSNTLTQIVDADFPTPHIPTPVAMDGYLFVAKSGTQDIYNCLPADLDTWQATTFIRCEGADGFLVGLSRHQNFVVAHTTDATLFFRDAGVAPPNSPLLREASLTQRIGLADYKLVTTIGDRTFLIGIPNLGSPGLYAMEDKKLTKISTPPVDRLWHYANTLDDFKMIGFGNRGSEFICLEVASSSSLVVPTFVIEVNTKKWYFWTARNPSSPTTRSWDLSGNGQHTPWGVIGVGVKDGQVYGWNWRHSQPLKLLRPQNTSSYEGKIDFIIRTPHQNFKTLSRKTLSRVKLGQVYLLSTTYPVALRVYGPWSPTSAIAFTTAGAIASINAYTNTQGMIEWNPNLHGTDVVLEFDFGADTASAYNAHFVGIDGMCELHLDAMVNQ